MAFNALNTALTEAAQRKVDAIEYAKECFESALALEITGADDKGKAHTLQGDGALALTMAMLDADKPMTRDEMNAILGDFYGWKETSTGKVSKTPEGRGNDIRKRIVRVMDVATYLKGGDKVPTYLEGVDKDEPAQILTDTLEGTTSIWTAYDSLGSLKEKAPSVDMAINLKTLAKLADQLTMAANVETILDSPELVEAYAVLHNCITTIGEAYDQRNPVPSELKEAA